MARLRGFLWLLAGLVVALLAAYVGFVTISRATVVPATAAGGAADLGPKVEVVVAARAAPVRTILTADDVKLQEVAPGSAPDNAVKNLEDAVGKVSLTQLFPGEMLLGPRLLKPNTVSADGRYALFINEDELLIALPAQDALSRSGVLKPGDKVDVHVSLDMPTERVPGAANENAEDEQQTFAELQNLQVAAVLGPQGPIAPREVTTDTGPIGQVNPAEPVEVQTILLTAPAQDALVVKYALDAGGTVSFALRAPDNDKTYQTDPVDVDYLINRYGLPIQVGK